MKIVKRVLLGILIVVMILTAGFTLWAVDAAQPTEIALDALSSDGQVVVRLEDGFITFEPVQQFASAGFIFYPGGRVDYRAYAPVLHQIAEQGYLVAIVQVNLNLAFFDVNAADGVVSEYPSIQHWVVGGHSLGGVAAASYASAHPDVVDGVVFWASYPSDDSLKNSDISVLSIYASNDGVATGDKIEASKVLLPPQTEYVLIEGGNHAQFGAYGPQSGDNPASIPAGEQWTQVADATVKFLEAESRK